MSGFVNILVMALFWILQEFDWWTSWRNKPTKSGLWLDPHIFCFSSQLLYDLNLLKCFSQSYGWLNHVTKLEFKKFNITSLFIFCQHIRKWKNEETLNKLDWNIKATWIHQLEDNIHKGTAVHYFLWSEYKTLIS